MMKERTMVDDEDNEVESFFIKDEIRQMSNITLTRNIPSIDIVKYMIYYPSIAM